MANKANGRIRLTFMLMVLAFVLMVGAALVLFVLMFRFKLEH